MAEVPSWRLAGDWFDVCRCRVPCGCTFAQAPDDGTCEGILAWHVREGRYGDVVLDGLNVVAVSRFEGNIWSGDTKAAMGFFVDERADEGQRDGKPGQVDPVRVALLDQPRQRAQADAVRRAPARHAVDPAAGADRVAVA